MPKKPSIKMKRFAKAYLETGNATQAVIDAGYDVNNRHVAQSIGAENLAKPVVMQMIENFAPKAELNIQKLADEAENEGVRLSANKDILDRSGFLPVQKSQHIEYKVNIDDKRFSEVLSAYQSARENKKEIENK